MIRRALIMVVAAALAACSPELLPRPQTPGPTLAPATSTPVPIVGPVVPAPGLTSIHMLDERNGWGISDTNILRTGDGGTTWIKVSPQKAGPLGYSVLSDFLDEQHAWILAPDPSDMLKGILYKSGDGGASWEQIPVPFGGGAMHFLDSKDGWMLASLGAGAGSMGVAVFQTNDGGSIWTQSYTNDPNQANAGKSLPLGGLKDGLSPIDMQVAWIGGVTYAPGVIYLYRTKDAGASWEQVQVKVPDGYDQADFETRGPIFTTANTAYLPVTVSSQNGVMLAVYVSRDGGTSWLVTPNMIPQGGAMDFVSTQDGFVWNGTNFYVTHDGAQTWTTVSPDVTFGDSFSGMDFVTPITGFVLTGDASGAHGLYKTNNGGSTWDVLQK
jgi:photosystem II stability/assembly factor-like uncharacterized protein